MRSTLLILYIAILTSFTTDESKTGCNREQLKGLYTYLGVQYAYTYRMDSTVMDKYADIGLNLEYRIKWDDSKSCNHDLIVTKVTPYGSTAKQMKHLYKVGDVLHIKVMEVNKEYMKYRTTFNGHSSETTMFRITDEMLMGK